MNKNRRADVIAEAAPAYDDAAARGLMHVTIEARRGKRVALRTPSGRRDDVVEFINCSYLGLDTHPAVVEAAAAVVREWGVHFCCARSRFTIAPNTELEEALSSLFRGHALTFPSVTSAHLSTLPLVASGALLLHRKRDGVRMIFDRFAHASMQSLKPLLRDDATVVTVAHNDVDALAREIDAAHSAGEEAVYVADSVYSMGGVCPLDTVLPLLEQRGAYAYLDDAHGTSIFGARGEGYVLAQLARTSSGQGVPALPPSLIITYSLAKGFGANGGGVVLPTEEQRRLVRFFGQTYAFSAPLDFSVVAAALAGCRLHDDGTVAALQTKLWRNVALFDEVRAGGAPLTARARPDDAGSSGDDDGLVGLSPIRMVPMRSQEHALDVGERLLERGFFVSVALYPVVPRDRPQLRVCISVDHSDDDIRGLCAALNDIDRDTGAAP